MDEHEAKLILASYTLDNIPENDSKFDEALECTKTNSELMAWWTKNQVEDQEIQKQLASAPVPQDLRASLLSTMENARIPFWRRRGMRQLFAVAACLALSCLVYFQFILDRTDEYTGPLAERAFNYSFDGPRLSYFDKNSSRLIDWLEEQNFDVPDNLPTELLEQKGIGCRPLNWSPKKVAIMCFNADTVYHLFIAKAEDFKDFEADHNIIFQAQKKGWTVSKWKSNDHIFVLTGKSTPEQMSRHLANYTP